MKIPVDFQVFLPAEDDIVDAWIGVMKLFGVQYDIFIRIFQQVGQHRAQRMVAVRGSPVEIIMREKIHIYPLQRPKIVGCKLRKSSEIPPANEDDYAGLIFGQRKFGVMIKPFLISLRL